MSNLSSDLASLKIPREAPSSSGGTVGKAVLWIALVVGLGVGAYHYGWPMLEARVFKITVEITEVATVSPAQASVVLTATGYVAAQRSSKVAPKVAGRVLKVYIAQGERVEVGQPLLEMDPADEKASILAAQSKVAAARARADSASAQIETASAQLQEVQQQADRERRLVEQGVSPAGVVQDLDARVASLKRNKGVAEAAHQAAEAEARALGTDVLVLNTHLNNFTLFAPLSGTVMNKPPEVGEFIGPQPAGVSIDMGGIEIADFATLIVEVDVPEQRLHAVAVGGPAEIVLEAFPERRLRGKTLEVTPKIDRAKATVKVKVGFVDTFDRTLPEMSARVSFLNDELDAESMQAPPKTIVSQSAVVERGGASVVLVVDGGRVSVVPVRLGAPFGKGVELLDGPPPGARLVNHPSPQLQGGSSVIEKGP